MTMRAASLLSFVIAMATGCTSLERPEVIVTNMSLLDSTLFEQRVQIDLRILNPNDVEVPVRGLDVKLDVNGIRLARGVSGERFVIPPFGEAQTSIATSTSVFDLMQQLTILTGPTELGYGLKGRLHIDRAFAGSLAFEREGTLMSLEPAFGGQAPTWIGIDDVPIMTPLVPE